MNDRRRRDSPRRRSPEERDDRKRSASREKSKSSISHSQYNLICVPNLTTYSNPNLITAENDNVDERKETDEREASKQNPEPTGDNEARADQD